MDEQNEEEDTDNNFDLPIGIQKQYKEGIFVGFKVQRKEVRKYFMSSKHSMKEKFELAQKCLNELNPIVKKELAVQDTSLGEYEPIVLISEQEFWHNKNMENYINMGHIYLITSPSKKCYVGQTKCVLSNGDVGGYLKRWKAHIIDAKGKRKCCRILDNAINKYGAEYFNVELLEEITLDLLDDRERHWISQLATISPNGYNIDNGGKGGGSRHVDTRRKVSETRLVNNVGRGKEFPKNTRKRPEDADLPKYISSIYDKDKFTGYIVNNHPKLQNKKFGLSLSSTKEGLLKLTIEYLLSTNPEHIRTIPRASRVRNFDT